MGGKKGWGMDLSPVTLTWGHPEDGLLSTTQERLVQKQSWEQKGGAAWVPSPCSWHLLVPYGSRGQAVPTEGAELQWKKPLDQQGSHCDGGGEHQELAGQGLPPASCPVSHESEDAR